MTQPEATPPPEEKVTSIPFDQSVMLKLRSAAADVLLAHPEVRSVIAMVDYGGGLNTADITKAVWLGPKGTVTDVAAIFGSIQVTLNMLGHMVKQAAFVEQQMRAEVTRLAKEIAERNKTLELTQQIEAKKSPAGVGRGACPHCGRTAGRDSFGHCLECGKVFAESGRGQG